MSGEIQFSYQTGKTCYALIRDRTGKIWNGSAFEVYTPADYSTYPITTIEQGSSSYYVGSIPTGAGPGIFMVTAKQQMGGSPAESDPTTDVGDVQFNGANTFPLSDLVTSGMLSQFGPFRIAKGTMVKNFPIYLKSAADHITPLTSGIISGQISRDGGVFGPLQSGAFTEVGQGFFSLQALTSGDTLADTVSLLFNGSSISGGVSSDPYPISFITQKVSGSL